MQNARLANESLGEDSEELAMNARLGASGFRVPRASPSAHSWPNRPLEIHASSSAISAE